MSKYEINVTAIATVSQYVEVDADNEEDAIQLAIDLSMQQTEDFEIDNIEDITDTDIVSVWEDDD
jgi:hypothetical protein